MLPLSVGFRLADGDVEEALIIPAGTYKGQSSDITTTSLPVVTYTTTNMSNDVSNNQVEMAFSFMTPVISTTTTDFNDISMNEID